MDERVAISHWSPRFTTNRVTAGDLGARLAEEAGGPAELLLLERQPRLREPVAFPPLPDRRLGRGETRCHDPAAGRGPRMSGRGSGVTGAA
jgi:hypothetical protein